MKTMWLMLAYVFWWLLIAVAFIQRRVVSVAVRCFHKAGCDVGWTETTRTLIAKEHR